MIDLLGLEVSIEMFRQWACMQDRASSKHYTPDSKAYSMIHDSCMFLRVDIKKYAGQSTYCSKIANCESTILNAKIVTVSYSEEQDYKLQVNSKILISVHNMIPKFNS